jgi:hypothetical protein
VFDAFDGLGNDSGLRGYCIGHEAIFSVDGVDDFAR